MEKMDGFHLGQTAVVEYLKREPTVLVENVW
jgi:hypothetical protein